MCFLLELFVSDLNVLVWLPIQLESFWLVSPANLIILIRKKFLRKL